MWSIARTKKEAQHRLYDPASGRFFVRNGEWTDDEAQASCFDDVVSLVQLCLRYSLKDAEMSVQTGKGPSKRVPLFA